MTEVSTIENFVNVDDIGYISVREIKTLQFPSPHNQSYENKNRLPPGDLTLFVV